MEKYHNQEVILKVVASISSSTDAEKQFILEECRSLRDDAKYEVSKINVYTDPEEIKKRKDILCYYEDVLSYFKENK